MPEFRAAEVARALRTVAARRASVPSGDRARQDALALIERESLAATASGFRIFPVAAVRGAVFDLRKASISIPGFGPFAEKITAIAAGACTLGGKLEARVSALFQVRRPLVAHELDAIGTELLFCVAERVVAGIRREARRAGLRASAELNPGDPGLELDQQPVALALADGATLGIAASASGMLTPVKSLTFVVALGRGLPQSASGRCDRCSARDRCSIRQI